MKYRTFQPQFHAAIRAGIKISTIRGKQWCNVGDRVAHRNWTGAAYRSPMGILSTAIVDQVAHLYLCDDGPVVSGEIVDATGLALQEGFPAWADMHAWFYKTHGLPYTGILTRWDPKTLEIAP